MKKINLTSTIGNLSGTLSRAGLLLVIGALLATVSFGFQVSTIGSLKNPVKKVIQTPQPGVFSASASSPVPLTCITADPNTGYVYAQENGGLQYYRYLPFSDTWEQMTDSPLDSGNNGGGAYLNGKIYTTYTSQGELGVYDIATNSWTTILSPLSGTGDITSDGTNLYLVVGNSFVRYEPTEQITTPLAEPVVFFQPWGGLAIFNGFIYGHTGNNSSGFAKYEIATDQWTALPDVPGGAVLGCAIDPVGQVYYSYGGYGGSNWYAFDMVNEQWSVTEFPLFNGLNDGGMVYVAGTGIYMTFSESSTGFGRIVLTVPTSVSSIFADSPSPVSGPTVSWTVIFNDPVSNVNAGNFVFENDGLGGTPAITSVTPIGGAPATQWTVTANAGTGNGALGLDMVNDIAISNAVDNLPFVGAFYTFDRTAPVAIDDSYSVNQDSVLIVADKGGLLTNDGDINGDPISAILVDGPTHGVLVLNANGSFTYTPTAGYFGQDSFTYTANDGTANSNVATVSIDVAFVEPPMTTMQFSSQAFSGREAAIALVTVTRTGDTSGVSTVEYSFTDQTAVRGTCGTSGVDYQAAVLRTVTFEANETSKTINFLVCPDNRSEDPAETALITLGNPTGGMVGAQSQADLTFLDAATDIQTLVPVLLSAGSTGSPYGTQAFVNGFPSRIGGVRVTLYGVTHSNPQNLQVMLVGPNGTGYVLMAGVGLNTPVNNATITFEDAAPTFLPDASAILDGVNYRPTVCGFVTPFPAPAPDVFAQAGCGAPGLKSLSPTLAGTFGGSPGDGVWTLYVQDVSAPGATTGNISGSIDGWGMQFLLPTAADVSLSGHVTTSGGSPIANALVTVEGSGIKTPITVRTGRFGSYKFSGLTAGSAYIVSAIADKTTFQKSQIVVQMFEDQSNVDFIGLK
ncbi:MAG: Ig-like domain-containing protein [Acidobacteriota bacterium]